MTNKRSNDDDRLISEAVAVLSETFVPAETIDDSARRYTTAQIMQAINELCGRTVPADILYGIMTEYGFRYVIDESSTTIRYVWLLKYRTNR